MSHRPDEKEAEVRKDYLENFRVASNGSSLFKSIMQTPRGCSRMRGYSKERRERRARRQGERGGELYRRVKEMRREESFPGAVQNVR